MRKAMIDRVEIASVIELDLAALVIDHRVHAVLVRQREIEQLELDRHVGGSPVGRDVDGAAVDAGGTIASRVDLDPDRLVLVRSHPDRQAAAVWPRTLGHELHRLPPCRIARRRRRAGRVDPVGVRPHRDMHIVFDEQFDRAIDVIGRIERGRAIHDAAPARRLQFAQCRVQACDAVAVRLHDHLYGDDLIARAEDPHASSVPDGVTVARRVAAVVAVHLVAVAGRPDRADGSVGRRRARPERKDEEQNEQQARRHYAPPGRGESAALAK